MFAFGVPKLAREFVGTQRPGTPGFPRAACAGTRPGWRRKPPTDPRSETEPLPQRRTGVPGPSPGWDLPDVLGLTALYTLIFLFLTTTEPNQNWESRPTVGDGAPRPRPRHACASLAEVRSGARTEWSVDARACAPPPIRLRGPRSDQTSHQHGAARPPPARAEPRWIQLNSRNETSKACESMRNPHAGTLLTARPPFFFFKGGRGGKNAGDERP